MDHLKRCRFFGDEQYRSPCMHCRGNDIRNRLRFTGTGRTLDYQIRSEARFFNRYRLRAVRIENVDGFREINSAIDGFIVSNDRSWRCEPIPLPKQREDASVR